MSGSLLADAVGRLEQERQGTIDDENLDDDPVRAIIVYGSETGNSKRGVSKMVKYWQEQSDGSYTIEGIFEANAVAGNLRVLRNQCEMLIVATSSFGEGDPPANFAKFLLSLLRCAQAGDRPLQGMQHAVIGYGQSVYPSFQNCPRLTDKLLEECGSRRCVRRVELDEGQDDDSDVADREPGADQPRELSAEMDVSGGSASSRAAGINRFQREVHEALQLASRTVKKPPVCSWREPADSIMEKSIVRAPLSCRIERTHGLPVSYHGYPVARVHSHCPAFASCSQEDLMTGVPEVIKTESKSGGGKLNLARRLFQGSVAVICLAVAVFQIMGPE